MSNNEKPVFDLLYVESVFFVLMILVFIVAWALGLIDTPERTFDDVPVKYYHALYVGALWLFVRFVRLS
jgi:hypothetical protein